MSQETTTQRWSEAWSLSRGCLTSKLEQRILLVYTALQGTGAVNTSRAMRTPRQRGPRGGSRLPLNMVALLVFVVGLSLVFILANEQQILQKAHERVAAQERRTTDEALQAFVIPPKSLREEIGPLDHEEIKLIAETLHDIAVAPTPSLVEQDPEQTPPATEIFTAPVLTVMPSEVPISVAPREPTDSPAENKPGSSESSAAQSSTAQVDTPTTSPTELLVTTPTPSLTDTVEPANNTASLVDLRSHPARYDARIDGDLSTNFECVGWRRTGEASPDGPREPEFDQNCGAVITGCISGYCVFRHKQSGELRRALLLHSNSMACHMFLKCEAAPELLGYGQASVAYVHDPDFDFDKNRRNVRFHVLSDLTARQAPVSAAQKPTFDRGITMVVHERALGTAYATIRYLRALGSNLPVEIWYRRDELEPSHPILNELVTTYGIFLREILEPNATGFYTKLYAVFYSAFDHVLLLDADNFAVKDPSYLFDTPEYQATGAMFWPDFWRPAGSIFDIIEEDLLWEVLGIDFVDMFEQESGQVLIDRKRHQKALNVLMYYGFHLPRVIEKLEFAWGDKDLFRFAWMKTNSSFHFISRPPGSGGMYDPDMQKFCGLTMVQHNPKGEIVFLHRNSEKITTGNRNKLVWTHIQQLKLDAHVDHYKLKYDPDSFEGHSNCWGLDESTREFFTMTPMTQYSFRYIETELLKYAQDAGWLVAGPPLLGYEQVNLAPKVESTEKSLEELDRLLSLMTEKEPQQSPLDQPVGGDEWIPSPIQRAR